MAKKKTEARTLDRALIIMTVLFVLFSTAVLVVYWHTGSEPTVLVGGWCASVLGEIIACTRIKLGKQRDKYHDKYEDGEDGGRGYQV